jgi:hypothetical protein
MKDPAGDAIAAYSTNVPQGPVGDNVPGMDLTDVQIGPEVNPESGAAVKNGGFTVRMKVADLSDSALQNALVATTSTSLVFLFRYIDGYQQSSVAAYWDPITGFRFAHDDYTEAPPEATTLATVRIYPGATAVPGAVDQDKGVITLSVPRSMLKALTPWKKGCAPRRSQRRQATGSTSRSRSHSPTRCPCRKRSCTSTRPTTRPRSTSCCPVSRRSSNPRIHPTTHPVTTAMTTGATWRRPAVSALRCWRWHSSWLHSSFAGGDERA